MRDTSSSDGDPGDTAPPLDTAPVDTAPLDTAPVDTHPDTDTADTAAADPCAGLALCDSFEAGDTLDPAAWEVTSPDCSGSGALTLDTAVAHTGARSVRVDGGGGYCDHVFARSSLPATMGAPLFARFYVRFAAPLGDPHVTFLAMTDDADGGHALRMGGQSGILMWNRASDDATLPVLSPAGIATSLSPEPDRWMCVELEVDGPSGRLTTWVDGEPVPGLQADPTPTDEIDSSWSRSAWNPSLSDFALGWESYAGEAMVLWFDDVALSNTRIGCG